MIEEGAEPDTILPTDLSYVNGRFVKVKAIVDNQNVDRSFSETPSMLTYNFVNAFPTQLTALPVSYEGSTITKTSVTFAYDRYVVQKHTSTTAPRGNPLEIAADQLVNVFRPQ